MIKAKIDREKQRVQMKGHGEPKSLVVEIATLIHFIWLMFNKKNPELAEEFKNRLIGTMITPGSPVFKED